MPLPLTSLDLMAHDIYACVCTALDEAATDLGPAYPGCPPCGGVVPGQIAWDACAGCAESSGCGGQLSVAVRRIYPTSFDIFPRQFSGVQGTKGCPTALNVAAEIVIGSAAVCQSQTSLVTRPLPRPWLLRRRSSTST